MTSLRTLLHSVAAVATLSLAVPTDAHAYEFTVQTANQAGTHFDAVQSSPGFNAASAITATFKYFGPLNFSNTNSQNSDSKGDLNSVFFGSATLVDYSGAGSLGIPASANFSDLTHFLASSGSASDYQYGSLYKIDLGVLAKGTELTIRHDDGASVYQGETRIGTTTAGPTSAITEMVTLNSTADTVLYYSRENGSPSVLQVAVPEPASMALLGAGLVGLGMVRRRVATR